MVQVVDGQPEVHQVDHVEGLAARQTQQKVLWLYVPEFRKLLEAIHWGSRSGPISTRSRYCLQKKTRSEFFDPPDLD